MNERLFVTRLHRAALNNEALRADIEAACLCVCEDDEAGQAWSAAHKYDGYTSYASLNDLSWRMPAFAELERALDKEVSAFARALDFDLGRRKLKLNALWINILEPGGAHTGHIHPHSVISGTFYVVTPDGASSLKFEDPRLAMMMAAPMRKEKARLENKPFVFVAPKAGDILMWESWLRHEVTPNEASSPRISVSFNYA